ncbi:MAG TPA: TRAP transporter large permease subunit [Candidatus Tectomicrobia bacterium]|nr:TRAP transporter large permease subunit [Candidatus Tectomicrobia bacterium]
MSNLDAAGLILAAMLVLIALRVPIGAAMFAAGAVGYGAMVGQAALLSYLKGLLWARLSVYDLSVIPLFLLMGQFASAAGFSRTLFSAASALMGHRQGGVAMAAIAACAAFGAICGSSVATAATMSQVALPEMKRLAYSDRLATGTLAVGGTLGILIPPSVILIIYALLAEQSIVKLFAAAFVPGALAVLLYLGTIAVYVRLVPGHATVQPRASAAERRAALRAAWPVAIIFLGVFAGIYGGYFTATEGAAVGTVATLALGVARGELDRRAVVGCFLPTAQATAMILTVLLGANMMNTALAVTRVPADLAAWIGGLQVPPLLVLAGFLLGFILVACVLDELAMMLLLLPILLPSILALDLFGLPAEHKAVWFGILMLTAIGIGLVAPPIGLNVYVVANIARGVPIGEIYRGVLPFLVADLARLALVLLVPPLALWALRFVR